MTKITEKITNTAKSYMGGAKQAVGETVGSSDLAASGAAQKTEAETSQAIADAKLKTEGVADKIEGKAKAAAGSLTGDTTLEASGHADDALGDVKRN
ncbi:hypothetical protein BGZ54_002188, partial [Gamsiella multidivaricata]